MKTVRWNIDVSPDTDQSLRMHLAGQSRGRKGDMSHFVEEVVRARILELSVDQAKAVNAAVNEADLTAIVEEAIEWSRSRLN